MNTAASTSFDRLYTQLANNTATPPWLANLRAAGMARFRELGWPTHNTEEWRFTNLRPVIETDFQPSQASDGDVAAAQIEEFSLSALDCHRLVFIDGTFAPQLSALGTLPSGVIVSDLATTLESDEVVIQRYLNQAVHRDDINPFVALNNAFATAGAVVRVPAGVHLEQPVNLLFVNSGATPNGVSHPRNLVIAEENSAVTVVESYAGIGNDRYLTNSVAEFTVMAGARVDHCRLQREGINALHISAIHANQARDSRFSSHNITFGGRLARTETSTTLNDTGCEAIFDGFYLGRDNQLIDNMTSIDHAHPHCNSYEIYKGILDDQARAVFNGRIFVREDAQKTNAEQVNRALLLSDDAVFNTKPQLEIFADDVRCTHGATVGQLDPQALFYLRSRGIDHATAQGILTYAFAGEALERIPVPEVRAEVDRLLVPLLNNRAVEFV